MADNFSYIQSDQSPVSGNITRRASLYTLGCRLNQSETNLIKDKLVAEGYKIVPFGDEADLGIINTCTVTREADSKCRQTIRQFIRRNPNGFTAVIGCYSQMGARAIAGIEGVDLIIGNQQKMSVLDYVSQGKLEHPLIVSDKIDKADFSITFVGDEPFNKRANLKIQDGCDFICSFCIIPFARGRARARELTNLLAEARALVNRGVRELILTGVNIGTYDFEGNSVLTIVDKLNEIPGLERIRISSIEPTTIEETILLRMADTDHKLVPYLHIPLQSGSDFILERMRRRYGSGEFVEFINKAARIVPDICIGTDIMVGFPEESEEEFEKSCRVFLENPFAYCHVFPYSEREGTAAIRREDQVPVPERQRRAAWLRRLSAKKRYDFYERFLGKTVEVLVEDPKSGYWPGLTSNFIRISLQSDQDLTNRLVVARLIRINTDIVEAELIRVVR